MRRLASLLPLLVVPLAAAACGGGGSRNSSSTTLPEDPAAAVTGAVDKTLRAGSEHVSLTGRVAAGGQTVILSGSGGFDTKKRVGSLTGTVSVGGLNSAIEEVSSGTSAYVKADLLSAFLPAGKTWVKLDLAKVAKSRGVDITSLLSQDPTQALARLKGLTGVVKIGPATVDAVPATHYRARLDLSKLNGATSTGTGRYDVWIGEDGYVRRVTAIVTSSGATSTLTTRLSAFGEPVIVDLPTAADTFDGTKTSIPGLGG